MLNVVLSSGHPDYSF